MSFNQKYNFWLNNSKNWIISNPVQWLIKIPAKLFFMWGIDIWSIRTLANLNIQNPKFVLQKILMFGEINTTEKIKIFLYILINIIHHLIYYSILFVIIQKIRFSIKNGMKNITKIDIISYSFLLLGTLSIIISVGIPRYKYPYFILLLINIAPFIYDKYLSENTIKKKR